MGQVILFRFVGPNQVEWLPQGGVPETGAPAALAARASGQRLVLVAPGEMIMLTQVTVPGRYRGTWLKAIPYALEENLAGEVEDLHFAAGEAVAGMPVPVAVVSHDILSSWLATCAQVDILPHAVVPEPLLLPREDGAWSVLIDHERAVVRSGDWRGFACERENLMLMLRLALDEEGQKPTCLSCRGEVPAELAHLDVAVQQQDAQPDPFRVLVYEPAVALNLLQGPYRRGTQLEKWIRPWRIAGALLGVWLVLQLLMQVAEYWRLRQEQLALQTEMEQIYRDAVPNARRLVNVRAQLENRLRQLRGEEVGSAALFFDLLYRSGRTLVEFEEVALRGLRYKDNRLDLSLEGGNLQVFDHLKQRLEEQTGLAVLMRTSKSEDKVASQVTLKKAPS